MKATAPRPHRLVNFNRKTKFLRHLDRIVEWREKGTTIPIQITLDPTYMCNHRCPGCHGLMGQDHSMASVERIEALAGELGRLGLKSMPLGGGGDPSCHPHLDRILRVIRGNDISTGLYTNGELLRAKDLEAIIDCSEWIRISLDADGPEMHQKVHGASPIAFEKVVANVRRLVEGRARSGADLVIGVGFLVRPDTGSGMYPATVLCRELGVDYIRFRPFFGYDNKPLCTEREADWLLSELERCKSLETGGFEVNYPQLRWDWVATGEARKTCFKCNIHHFLTNIGGDLKVYLCCHTVGWEKYCLGDLNEMTFEEIWFSKRREEIYRNIDYGDCATPCSLATFNELLEQMETPQFHENFL